jgi:hypothetical protein
MRGFATWQPILPGLFVKARSLNSLQSSFLMFSLTPASQGAMDILTGKLCWFCTGRTHLALMNYRDCSGRFTHVLNCETSTRTFSCSGSKNKETSLEWPAPDSAAAQAIRQSAPLNGSLSRDGQRCRSIAPASCSRGLEGLHTQWAADI